MQEGCIGWWKGNLCVMSMAIEGLEDEIAAKEAQQKKTILTKRRNKMELY